MLNIRTHTISGAELRAKSKSGMTSEQITKELLNSPTEEVKPSQVAQLMKENAELKEENAKLKQRLSDRQISLSIVREENVKLKEKNAKFSKLIDIIHDAIDTATDTVFTEIAKSVDF
jgi:regulator of replication initiation timing